MKSICVFCGSSSGKNPLYGKAARELGKLLAEKYITLVYGGSNVGLMGVLADSNIQSGGINIGIMPKSIAELEIAHTNLTELILVDNMFDRKQKMAELSDGFIALPGGFGTLDELTEVLTYSQLRIYDKPIGVLNTDGYFDHFLKFLDHTVEEGFVRMEHRQNIIVSAEPENLIKKMHYYQPVHIGKWIEDIKEEKRIN
ncbi:MAG: TIGR00730 family Rossman fold protein [Bacteroidales bacterium]|nr:TIGR00730 family Rossman fold protein [Bacteroidales bacterium]